MVCPACTDRAACRKAKDCAAAPQRIVVTRRRPLSARKAFRSLCAVSGMMLMPWQERVIDAVADGRRIMVQPSRRTVFDRAFAEFVDLSRRSLGRPSDVIAGLHAGHVVLDEFPVPSDRDGATRRSGAENAP